MDFFKKIRKVLAVCSGFFVLFLSITANAESTDVTVGKALNYPNGYGYMTHYFYMGGQLAYCLEPKLGPMSNGSYETSLISDNGSDGYPLLVKVLACGYGGPNDLTPIYFPGATEEERYIYTHIAAGYAYKSAAQSTNDITGLTTEQFEESGLGDFVRAAWNTSYKGTVKIVKVNGYQDIGYLASYYLDSPPQEPIPTMGRLEIYKRDSETNDKAQGDATFKGAEYKVFAADTITDQIDSRIIYEKDSEVATLITDENGYAYCDNLPVGSYRIKETISPEGYSLNENETYFEIREDNTNHKVTVIRELTDDVIKGYFEIDKSKEGDTYVKVKNAGFSAYLESEIPRDSDGNYDFSSAKAVPLTTDNGTVLYTDENGFARSGLLPFGTYIVREEEVPKNYEKCEDFTVTVSVNNRENPTDTKEIADKSFKIKFKINKIDSKSKNYIKPSENDEVLFDIFDVTKGEYAERYIKLNEEGFVKTDKMYEAGTYRIEEVNAPNGYVGQKSITFEVDDESEIIIDSDGEEVFNIDFENEEYLGEILIKKIGEKLSGFEKGNEKDGVDAKFIYKDEPLAEAEFSLYANETIYYPDKRTDESGNWEVLYDKDELIGLETSDEEGKAYFGKDKYYLCYGEYYVIENKAPKGYIPSDERMVFSFKENDSNENVVVWEKEWKNERQKFDIKIRKIDDMTLEELKGATFAMYSDCDIYAENGELIAKKGEFLGMVTTDETGYGKFNVDLTNGKYIVSERVAPEGYYINDENITVSFEYDESGENIIENLTALNEKKPEPSNAKASVVKGVSTKKVTKNTYKTDGSNIEGYSIILKNDDNKQMILLVSGIVLIIIGILFLSFVFISLARRNGNG